MSSNENTIEIISAALVREYLASKRFLRALTTLDAEFPRSNQSITSRHVLAHSLGLHRPSKGDGTILEALVQKIILNNYKSQLTEEKYHKAKNVIKKIADLTTPVEIDQVDVITPQGKREENFKTNTTSIDDDLNKNLEELGENTKFIDPDKGGEESTSRSPVEETDLTTNKVAAAVTARVDNEEKKIDFLFQVVTKSPCSSEMVHVDSTEVENLSIKSSDQGTVERMNGEQESQLPAPCEFDDLSMHSNSSGMNDEMTKEQRNEDEIKNLSEYLEKPEPAESPPPRCITPVIPDGASPLTLPAALELKTLVFGDSKAVFPPAWRDNGVVFSESCPYGLEFHKDGPSGALAALQGYVLKALLFSATPNSTGSDDPSTILQPSSERSVAALVTAVSEVLWQCGQRKSACLAVPLSDSVLSGQGRYRRDGITEGLHVLRLNEGGVNGVQEAVSRHLPSLQAPGGCALFLCSAVLSRGLQQVGEDMGDTCTALLAQGGECAPELVSLVLTGRATMRQNKPKTCGHLDSSVPARAEVGLLALAEHYGYCKVGSFLKTPRFPIWLVLAHGRYSLLFSTRRQLVSDWRAELAFRLYLYRGGQYAPLQFAVATGSEMGCTEQEQEERPLTSVEQIIRTKWSGAQVRCLDGSFGEQLL